MEDFLKQWSNPAIRSYLEKHRQRLEVEAGIALIREGDPVTGIYFVQQGKLKITKSLNHNKDKIIRFAGTGSVVGHRGFGADWKYPISAVTLESSVVDFIPMTILKEAMKKGPDLAYGLMMFFAEELRESEENRRHLPVKYRLAWAIWSALQAFGYDKPRSKLLAFRLSRKDLASFADTTYETVIRTLSRLEQEGAIVIHGKSFEIADEKKLENLAKAQPKFVRIRRKNTPARRTKSG